MFGTLNHPTPMALFLWAVWVVAQWRIAPPVSWIRPAREVVPADPAMGSRASQPR